METPITSTRDAQGDLVTYTVTGSVTFRDIAEAIAAHAREHPSRLVLWDFVQANLGAIPNEDVKLLAGLTRDHAGGNVPGRTALVFDSTVNYGMGRMFEILQQVQGSGDRTYRAFRAVDEALAWLKSGAGS